MTKLQKRLFSIAVLACIVGIIGALTGSKPIAVVMFGTCITVAAVTMFLIAYDQHQQQMARLKSLKEQLEAEERIERRARSILYSTVKSKGPEQSG